MVAQPGSADSAHSIELALSGNWSRAIASMDRYIAYSSYSFTPIHTWRLLLAHSRGDPEMLWSTVRRVLPDGPETKFGYYFDLAHESLIRLAVAQALEDGDLDGAHSWLEAHNGILAWSGAVLGQAQNALLWARYNDACGSPSSARECADRALTHATHPRQPLAPIAAHRFLGHLDTVDGCFNEAEQHLQESRRLADALCCAVRAGADIVGICRTTICPTTTR